MHSRKYLAAVSTCLALCVSLAAFAADTTPAATKPAATKPATAKKKAAPKKAAAPTWPDKDGLYNAAQTDLGASASGSGAPFNKDWPAIGAISPEGGKDHGTMIGNPMLKARVDIKLAAAVDIKAIETVGLDYHGTEQPKAIDIYVDGKMVKHAELPETPAQAVRTQLDPIKGQTVSVVITDQYPPRDLPDGKKGPAYGGWARIRVLTPTDLSSLMKTPAGYATVASADNITPTTGALASGKVEVVGQPREATGHPNTIWDQQDVKHYKEMLATSPELQKQVAALKTAMDLRMTRPIGVPEPRKNAAGEYIHISDADHGFGKINNDLSLDIANLGTLYALTGEEKYADFCKKILLAYADNFPNYRPGNRPGFAHDAAILFDQRLSDATWLIQVARGYDLIHDLPSMTTEERHHIENDVLKFDAKYITGNHAVLEAPTNWSAICTAAVLVTGYAIDDQDLINIGLYGLPATKEKAKGGMYLHFSDKAIADDGMWSEGSTGYQMMAMEALVTDAEVMWHHGVDMYRYRDAALKKLFDSPIRYAYPNLQTPAVSDGGGGSIVGYESNLWELGYERYRDPQYFLILNQVPKTLRAEFQKWPVSVLYDTNTKEAATAPEFKSVNLFSVGMGILRLPDDPQMANLTFLYGKPHSHGHPDKLSFDLYALGNRFMPDPGSVWYEQPLYHQWYHTTLAHNALVVDSADQQTCNAELITYGAARTMGIERGATGDAYPGVTLDRSLFMTPQYLVDIYGAFGNIPHTYDLAYHFIGELNSTLDLKAFPTPKEQLPNGYNALTDLKSASTDAAWSAQVKAKKGNAAFFSPATTKTEVLIGGGHYGVGSPPTVIERRANTTNTVFANAVDLSNQSGGYVKSVEQSGDLEKGYTILTVKTVKGDDLAFTAFRPGTYSVGGLETDAQQAFVLRDGKEVRSLFLAGGKTLRVGGVSLSRETPGLAVIEKTDAGTYLVSNPSPKEANLTVAMPALQGLDAFTLDAQGKRTGKTVLTSDRTGSFTVTLAANAQIELAKPGAPGFLETAQAAAKKRMDDANAAIAKAQEQADARSKTRVSEAAANPVPANTVIVVQAEDFSAQGGGQVTVADNKTATVGKAILKFDANDQWLEWNVDAPVAGYYNLTACYCTIEAKPIREISVNGTVQEPLAPLVLENTGGFSNGSDDWKLATALDPSTSKPLLIKLNKGKNTLRLTNTAGRGSNLDYLLITSPDVKPTREMAKNP